MRFELKSYSHKETEDSINIEDYQDEINMLKLKIKKYLLENVLNMYETALFYKQRTNKLMNSLLINTE